jgi:hypothetical protein
MLSQALVIDQHAVSILDAALIEDSWFQDFRVPTNSEGLRRIEKNSIIYLLSEQASNDSNLLVIATGPSGVFATEAKPRHVFERVLRVALRKFNRNISLPVQWQPYHEGSLLSIYAEPSARKSKYRIHFDQAPMGRGDIFAFALTDGPQVLSQVPRDISTYEIAIDGFQEAALTEPPPDNYAGNYGILLSEPLGEQLKSNFSLDEWYSRRLNRDQLSFVDQKSDRPIRLRGAAGTGKTQAMAVKCLRDLYVDADAGGDKSFAFLTHSSALAHDVVRGMFHAMDPNARWSTLKVSTGRPKLWIGTLYELAQDQLNYEKKGLHPLALDGRDGREFQRILIKDAIKEAGKDPRIALGVLRQCPKLAMRMASEAEHQLLIEELMNEFACVLDAENIRKGTADAERYIRGARESWQIHLAEPAERELVLEIHGLYRILLRNERLLSMDQMIADFSRYLLTHEWAQLCDRDGFDIIFVDEYHYFNRVEAMTLQSLFKPTAEHSRRWPLIMAYDLKQSTSDAALGGGIERFRNPGVGESIPVNLTQVFRSTPQIASFLRDLDGSFPAIDLEGEFASYLGVSQKEDGDEPSLITFDNNNELIDDVFSKAAQIARSISGGGSQVAILCLNEDLFDIYRKAGRISGKFVAITSREDLRELRYARSRCVFSMPEYVAGLQFHTVFLIHADRADLADEQVSPGARRRYISRVYLGASRAVQHLVLASSGERQGRSEILNGPIENGSLKMLPRT